MDSSSQCLNSLSTRTLTDLAFLSSLTNSNLKSTPHSPNSKEASLSFRSGSLLRLNSKLSLSSKR